MEEIEQPQPQKHNWITWLIIVIAIILLAIWARSCSQSNVFNNSQDSSGLCSNNYYTTEYWGDTIILSTKADSFYSLYKNIKETGNLDTLIGLNCLQSLEIYNDGEKNLKNISAIQYLPNLESLTLANTDIQDISPIAKLSKLKKLMITSINIEDLGVLDDILPNLTFLSFNGANIQDISNLVNANKLKTLGLSSTPIKDLSPLYELSNLKILHLHDTAYSRSWYKTEVNKDLDKQLRVLQTNNPDLDIRFSQFNVINGEGTPFGGNKYKLNFLDWKQFF